MADDKALTEDEQKAADEVAEFERELKAEEAAKAEAAALPRETATEVEEEVEETSECPNCGATLGSSRTTEYGGKMQDVCTTCYPDAELARETGSRVE